MWQNHWYPHPGYRTLDSRLHILHRNIHMIKFLGRIERCLELLLLLLLKEKFGLKAFGKVSNSNI